MRDPEIKQDGGYKSPATFMELLSCDNQQPGQVTPAYSNVDEGTVKAPKAPLSTVSIPTGNKLIL